MRSPITRHSIWQIAVDAALVAAAWWLAWNLRFEARPVYYDRYLDWSIVLLVVGLKLPVFALSGFYNRWWRYVSTRDMWGALRGVALASIAVFLVFALFDVHRVAVPRGVWFVDLLLCLAFVAGARLLARTLIERPFPGRIVTRGKDVVVVGAGDAAQLVVKEMQRSPALGYTPIGLLDDDPRKRNLRLHGVRVLGTVADLDHVVRDRRPDEILIAIPTAPGELRARIVETARVLDVPVKTLPSLSDLVSGDRDLARQLRPVEVEDVLGREPVDVDIAAIADYLQNEVVLVTGAGGSIGAELCRQIARLEPAKLVLMDNAEPALFEIERELVRDRRFRAAAAVVGDVKDVVKVRQVFDKYRPGVVFHAAAYKHVALMEANPVEAVRNNTLGTRVVADVAVEFGDEAVRARLDRQGREPEDRDGTVEGARRMDRRDVGPQGGGRDAVRRGSLRKRPRLLRLRRADLPAPDRARRPGDRTHPEMTRFFMTIPEAVQLIVQAGAIGGRGQVYVLDMGEPVRIVDLADKMIRLSGKEPGTEIAIEFIGPAPGEKLHEELVSDGETATPSPHPKIDLITRLPVDADWLEAELARARTARHRRRDARARRRLATHRRGAEARPLDRARLP